MIQDVKLKLGGKQRHFTFGIIFLGEVLDVLDLDYGTMLEKVSKNPFKYSPTLMYKSLENTYRLNKKDVDFTEDDIVNWLEKEDLLGIDKMIAFVQAFMGTQENKTPVEDVDVNDAKEVSKKK